MPKKKKTIALLIENKFQDVEALYPYYRLQEAGATVHLVAPKAGEYHGKYGYPLRAQKTIAQVSPAKYDAVVIPGGFAADYLRRDPRVAAFVRQMHNKGKVIASICHGGWILASAEIVKGKKLTSFFAIKDDLIHAGAKWVDKPVVVDGRLITSRKPDDLPDFCRAIIKALAI